MINNPKTNSIVRSNKNRAETVIPKRNDQVTFENIQRKVQQKKTTINVQPNSNNIV